MKFFALIPLLLLSMGCPPTKPSASGRVDAPLTPDTSETVAVVNGEKLSLTEFDRRIQSLAPFARARYATTEARLEFLEAQVEFEILADRAEKRGYGERPEVMHAVKEAMVRHLLAEELRTRVSMRDITEDEIRDAFEEAKDAYRSPRARKVALIGSDTAKTAENLRALIEDQPFEKPLDKLNMLRRLADVHHYDPALRRKGGDVGFVEDPASPLNKNQGLEDTLARHVFQLTEIGELTPVFEFQGKFYIASFIEEREARSRELRDVEDEIREKLYAARREEARKAITREARESAQIEVFEDVLKSVPQPETEDKTLERLLQSGNKVRVRDLRR